MAPTIPAPAFPWQLVHCSSFTVLTIDGGEQHDVALTDDGLTVTLSITGRLRTGQREAAVREHRILGISMAQVDVQCGGSAAMEDVILYESVETDPERVRLIREAIPNLYASGKEPGRRAALRAIWRRLEQQEKPADAGGSGSR